MERNGGFPRMVADNGRGIGSRRAADIMMKDTFLYFMIYGGLVSMLGGFCLMVNTLMIQDAVNKKLPGNERYPKSTLFKNWKIFELTRRYGELYPSGKLLRYRTIITIIMLHPFVVFIGLFILWLKK